MRAGERILVIRLSSVGDILLASPAIRALRNRFPESQIDFLVAEKFRDAAALIPHIDNIVCFNTDLGFSELWKFCWKYSRDYTILIDLQNSLRSAFLRTWLLPAIWIRAKRYRFKRWLYIQFKKNIYGELKPVPVRYGEAIAEIGGELDGQGLMLETSSESDSFADRYLRETKNDDEKVVIFCPGAKHFTKRWPENYWIDLGKILSDKKYRIFVVGSGAEKDMIAAVSSKIQKSIPIADWSLEQVGSLMKRAVFVVSNDSGLMHLASGVGIRQAAIFGPTVSEFGFYPYQAKSLVLENTLSCRPCSAMGSASCPKKHFSCMLNTSPETVSMAVDKLLIDYP